MSASGADNRRSQVCPWHQGLFSVRCTRLRGQQPGCSAPGRVRGGWPAQTYVMGLFLPAGVVLLTIYPEPHCVREVREVAPACPHSLRPDSRPASPFRVGPGTLCALPHFPAKPERCDQAPSGHQDPAACPPPASSSVLPSFRWLCLCPRIQRAS